MALLDLIKNVPDIGKQSLELILRPRRYVKNRSANPAAYESVEKTFLWLIGLTLVILTIYSRIFMPIQEDVQKASALLRCPPDSLQAKKPEIDPKPQIADVMWWTPSFGVGLQFLDPCLPFDIPQNCYYHVGGLFILIKDLKPDQFYQTGFAAFNLLILALVLTLCIYPAMRILKRKADIKMLLQFSVLYISSFSFFGVFLCLIVASILIHAIGLHGMMLIKTWIYTINLPLFFLLIRVYYVGFSELFSATKWRVFSGSIISAFISWAVSPVVFTPLLYVALWLIPLYDLILE